MSAKAEIINFPEKSLYAPETAETYTSCKLPKDVPAWWKEVRRAAYNRFWEQGLPTPKLERFKFTHIARAVRDWDGVPGELSGSHENGQGFYLSLKDAMTESWVKELLLAEPPGLEKYADTALWDLNTSYLQHGGVIDIPADTKVELPIDMALQGIDDTYTSLRLIIRVQKGAELTLTETHTGEGEYWKNHVTQIVLEDNAMMHHYRVQDDSGKAVYTQNTHLRIGSDSHYDSFTLTTGAALSRYQVHSDIRGHGSEASFNGINLLKDKQLADTTLLIEHQAPHCQSNQFIRSILAEQSHGVFQGKVHVYQEAQKTDGYQLSNALLLSEKAQMSTKPELEIYADDVKCSHGATTGQLDEEPLFYLRSRGLSESQARMLLAEAFLGEVLDKIEYQNFKVQMQEVTQKWLQTML